MNGKRPIVTICVLLGTLLLALTLTSSAFASPISSKKAQLRQVQAKLQTVYHQVDMAVEKYNAANSQLSTVQSQIKQNEHMLKVAEYKLGVANGHLTSRARQVYKANDTSILDVVFASHTFDDLLTQLDVMQRMTENDADMVHEAAALASRSAIWFLSPPAVLSSVDCRASTWSLLSWRCATSLTATLRSASRARRRSPTSWRYAAAAWTTLASLCVMRCITSSWVSRSSKVCEAKTTSMMPASSAL